MHPQLRARLATAMVITVAAIGAAAAWAAADRSRAVDPRSVPLGDGHVSSSPRVGYVDSCITHFGSTGGAQAVGPWINTRAHTWDIRTKVAVSGSVAWPAAFYRASVQGGRRVLSFNSLPVTHRSGTFPVAAGDAAAAYDRNPNHIAAQRFRWSLPLNPRRLTRARCTGGGPIGVLRDGVVLYNALDGEGRDAAAHEVLDRCAAHPDQSSTYHHHDIPPCILGSAPRGRTTLVGYALDGLGIYVEKDRQGNLPTNSALDACHGMTSRVLWNGRVRRVYHYVATLEYPYTVGCFRGAPIASGHSGGGGSGGKGQGGGPPGGGPPGGGPTGGGAGPPGGP